MNYIFNLCFRRYLWYVQYYQVLWFYILVFHSSVLCCHDFEAQVPPLSHVFAINLFVATTRPRTRSHSVVFILCLRLVLLLDISPCFIFKCNIIYLMLNGRVFRYTIIVQILQCNLRLSLYTVRVQSMSRYNEIIYLKPLYQHNYVPFNVYFTCS